MAVASIYRVLLIAVITRCRSEPTNGYHNNGKSASKFGELLKPPPPPLSNIVPVPFHGGASRSQRQNVDVGYHYQPPPPPPPPPLPPSSDFKFPAPFYKQYNFNFVPPPQPFTTPSSSLFQKVSGWLFPSQQTGYETPVYSSNGIAPVKKDCNTCNLVPWIPVIRYNLGAKKLQQNLIPTYGPPSPTAYASFQNAAQYHPQPFQAQHQNLQQPGVPHEVYGPPQSQISNYIGIPSSTYGPPSPTHTIAVASQNPPSSTYSAAISSTYGAPSTSIGQPSSSYGVPSSSFGIPSSSYGIPSSTYGVPSSSYGVPSSSYGVPSSTYGVPSSTYGVPSSTYGVPSSTYGVPSSTYGTPTSTFATPSPTYESARPVTTYESATPNYEPGILNNNYPQQNGVDVFKEIEPANELQLPKVTHPSGFRNSYGEPISNVFDIPYPVSATAAESTKIKTEILTKDGKNVTIPNLALANPAPFTLNRGRNIHTLQPVALPNLSVSPLPPIFNARPFRPLAPKLNSNFLYGLNYMQHSSNTNNVNIEQSLPIAEFTHSVDYPPSVIKSPIIDIDATRNFNQSKAYRNIANGFNIDEIRDISSQASEDHVSATKSDQDSSFESTGAEFGNDLYDTGLPSDLKQNSNVPSNHKAGFGDLRGIKDEDVDKYRTESNLQNIDSPLLYLKPSAPHKDFGNFVLAVSTPTNDNSYEIYDEIPTTAIPHVSTQLPSSWDESRTDYSEGLLPPPVPQEEENKPKIVQIIVPYTTSQNSEHNINNFNDVQTWTHNPEDEYQGRKVPSDTDNPYINTVTESFTVSTTTDDPLTDAEQYDSDRLNAQAILNDLYDVKEPPFDIIKLQHTIDDWTEQEYSKHKMPHKTRTSAKYAKQIPDEYFTTISPITNYVTAASNYNYEFYDHEGSSSIQHTVTDVKNRTSTKPRKEYNIIERPKTKYTSGKQEDLDEVKPHIYTAASSFRSTSTTPAPWGKIQTSISPLTKEKVYVVTSKPWRDTLPVTAKTNEWYGVESFESKKTHVDNDVSASDNLPFKSPRFSNRPSFGFTGSGEGKIESLKTDSSYGYSKSWHQSINDLESQARNSTGFSGGPPQNTTTNSYAEEAVSNTEEDTTTTTVIAEHLRDFSNV